MAQTTVAPNGAFQTEIFNGFSRKDVLEQMDSRLDELKAQGHQLTHRRAIGRNTPCPCGSGLKFKKCCLHSSTALQPLAGPVAAS